MNYFCINTLTFFDHFQHNIILILKRDNLHRLKISDTVWQMKQLVHIEFKNISNRFSKSQHNLIKGIFVLSKSSEEPHFTSLICNESTI